MDWFSVASAPIRSTRSTPKPHRAVELGEELTPWGLPDEIAINKGSDYPNLSPMGGARHLVSLNVFTLSMSR